MKKIITLLFCVGAFATSFAQYNRHQNNDDRNYRNDDDRNYRTENKRDDQYAGSSYGNRNFDRDGGDGRHYNHGDNYSAKDRDFQIEKINQDFNFQLQAIQCNRYMRRREKKAAIRNAEIERSRQIQMVNERFQHNNNWNY